MSLQQTLVLAILPELPRYLGTGADNASWLVTGTLVAGAVAIPTLSRLADMFGKKRMMLITLGLVIAGSMLGGFTDGLPLVIAGRALQGVGVAIVPIGISIMRDELPEQRLPLGVALMSATLAIGGAVALPLSGLLVSRLNWHSIFWITAVAGVVLFVAVALIVPPSDVRSGGSFDYPGAIVLSLAITTVLLGLTKGSSWGWWSARTIAVTVVGLALLVVWVPIERRARNPLVDLRVSTLPPILLVNTTSILAGFATFANYVATPQILQLDARTGYGLGLDPLRSGLWMMPSALTFGAMAPAAAWLIRRIGAKATLLVGVLVLMVTYVVRIYAGPSLGPTVVATVVVAVGASMSYAAMPSLIMASVPETETAAANGLNVLLRTVGTAAASTALAALTTGIIVTVEDAPYPSADAFTAFFWLAAGTAAIAVLLTLALMRTPAGGVTASR
ncbi:MAG: MFS transporter [Micromonosporaceae bacterium]|nr:MFS transporter [Micromonosporaceae bacterium]